MNSRILYISIDSIQEGVGSSQILPLIFALKNQGMDISLMTFEKSPLNTEVIQRFDKSGIPLKTFKFGFSGIFSYIYRFFTIIREARHYQIIHARSDFVAFALSFTNKPFLWDVRSFWAKQRIRMTRNPLKKLFFRCFNKLEFFIFHRCSAFSVLTRVAAEYFNSTYPDHNKQFKVVPTFVDLNKFRFSEPNFESKLGLLSGTFNESYDLDLLINVINTLKFDYGFRFVWARPVEGVNQTLEAYVDEIVTLIHDQVPAYLVNCSFGIAICHENLQEMKAAAPTKIAEFLAVGRPVLVSYGLGDFDFLIDEYKIGGRISRKKDLKIGLSEFVTLLSDSQISKRCRSVAENFFSLNSGVAKYTELYSLLSNKKK